MMIMADKMTITEQVNAIAFDTLTEEQFQFLKERALKSVRKAPEHRKPTKTQEENVGLKAEMRKALGEGLTATDAGKAVGISVQRASALLKQMVDAHEVERVKNGKATLFKAV